MLIVMKSITMNLGVFDHGLNPLAIHIQAFLDSFLQQLIRLRQSLSWGEGEWIFFQMILEEKYSAIQDKK